jgi:hypothetical protein
MDRTTQFVAVCCCRRKPATGRRIRVATREEIVIEKATEGASAHATATVDATVVVIAHATVTVDETAGETIGGETAGETTELHLNRRKVKSRPSVMPPKRTSRRRRSSP